MKKPVTSCLKSVTGVAFYRNQGPFINKKYLRLFVSHSTIGMNLTLGCKKNKVNKCSIRFSYTDRQMYRYIQQDFQSDVLTVLTTFPKES